MANFSKVKSYKDFSKTSTTLAAKLGFELLVGKRYDTDKWGNDVITDHMVELWYADEDSELFLIAYTIQDDGSLYFNCKTLDIHKELSKVEDLPLTIKDDKELKAVIKYVYGCLKG